MKTYIIICNKDIPHEALRDVLMEYNATGQICELDGAGSIQSIPSLLKDH